MASPSNLSSKLEHPCVLGGERRFQENNALECFEAQMLCLGSDRQSASQWVLPRRSHFLLCCRRILG